MQSSDVPNSARYSPAACCQLRYPSSARLTPLHVVSSAIHLSGQWFAHVLPVPRQCQLLIASAWPDARIYLPLAATPVVVELPELAAPELAAPPPAAAAVVLLASPAAAAPAAAELTGTGTGASVTMGSATNQGRTDF